MTLMFLASPGLYLKYSRHALLALSSATEVHPRNAGSGSTKIVLVFNHLLSLLCTILHGQSYGGKSYTYLLGYTLLTNAR